MIALPHEQQIAEVLSRRWPGIMFHLPEVGAPPPAYEEAFLDPT